MNRFSLNRRTFLGAGLAVLAAVMVIVVTRPPSTATVLVAGEDLGAGTSLEVGSLALRNVSDLEGLVEASDPADFAGWSLAAPLSKGEPVPRSLLRVGSRRSHPDVVALALDEDHAVLGVLVAGDLVDIYVTTTGEEVSTSLIATQVYVVDVIAGDDGFGSNRSARLLLAADRELAATIIAALHAGNIDLVRVAR